MAWRKNFHFVSFASVDIFPGLLCRDFLRKTFYARGMSKKAPPKPTASEQALLDEVRVVLIPQAKDRQRFQRLLQAHHYLGSLKPVGEQLYYAAVDAQGAWLALLLFSAAAKHLKHREQWIGWTAAQCDRRLSLVANNSRFLILPERSVPNLGSRALRLTLDRLSADWQAQYDHPVLVVETFVDPEQFCGTVYTANNWVGSGLTDGWGRHQRNYYVQHAKPKRLFVRELVPKARRSLQAEHLPPALAAVEQKNVPRCHYQIKEPQALTGHFKSVPEYRGRVESYPAWSLLTLILLAMLCEAPRGQKDLAKFARRLTQAQRRVLGFRRNPQGRYPAPRQSTFSRLLQKGHPVRDYESTTYVSSFQSIDQFGPCLRQEAIRRGLGGAGQAVVLIDGAHGLEHRGQDCFKDALQIVDFYHAPEHAGQVLEGRAG